MVRGVPRRRWSPSPSRGGRGVTGGWVGDRVSALGVVAAACDVLACLPGHPGGVEGGGARGGTQRLGGVGSASSTALGSNVLARRVEKRIVVYLAVFSDVAGYDRRRRGGGAPRSPPSGVCLATQTESFLRFLSFGFTPPPSSPRQPWPPPPYRRARPPRRPRPSFPRFPHPRIASSPPWPSRTRPGTPAPSPRNQT